MYSKLRVCGRVFLYVMIVPIVRKGVSRQNLEANRQKIPASTKTKAIDNRTDDMSIGLW
jgi:hypothetical protein